jgi:iron complex transport system permease protein
MNENEDPNGPYEGTSVQDTAGPPEGTAPKGRGPLKGLFSTLRKGYNGMKDDMVADDDDRSEISIKRRRFTIILLVGIFICAVMFMISIAISSGGIIPITDAFSALVSAIQKGGHDLDTTELYIFQSRLPRTIAAIGVGAGLAIAGCMFQALIRNPLVDPYITGVSSGAGCFAIAIVVMGITLSALSDFSNYIIPVAAIAGGLFAFGITLAVAEGAGGSATNYILAGTIVGFAFTSVQTIFLSLQKDNLTNVMWWLYGSFANITWENAFLVLIPALAISFIAMLWAREFNLFMSGEDQARQLGLKREKFFTANYFYGRFTGKRRKR